VLPSANKDRSLLPADGDVQACGYQFEHTVYFSASKIQPDLSVEENERAA
jgi:hypothetical protein